MSPPVPRSPSQISTRGTTVGALMTLTIPPPTPAEFPVKVPLVTVGLADGKLTQRSRYMGAVRPFGVGRPTQPLLHRPSTRSRNRLSYQSAGPQRADPQIAVLDLE